METTLAKTNQLLTFSEDQVSLIKKQIAPKASNDELQLFLYQAKRTGLDPLARQIYCIHRKGKDQYGNWIEKMTVQTSIDGFRVIAERSGDYGGQSEPDFVEQDGKLVACKITVYRFRGEVRYPAAVGVAYWNEYVPKEGMDSMWKKMPHTMLSKVAEALALRKAYPQDLSGLYTGDEMQQADNGQNGYTPAEPIPTQVVTEDIDALHKEFMDLLNEYKLLIGDAAMQYHPDEWKRGRGIKNYRAAIEDIKGKIRDAQAEHVA